MSHEPVDPVETPELGSPFSVLGSRSEDESWEDDWEDDDDGWEEEEDWDDDGWDDLEELEDDWG